MSLNREHDFTIQWHLTERCNLRCRHCYQVGGQCEDMLFASVRAIVSEVAAMFRDWQETFEIDFSCSFNITGGEPFLRLDLMDILQEMIQAGFECYVLSNGTLITRERAAQLADLGVAGVQVSLEGPEEVHDWIRGKGSFAASLKGLQNLREAGVVASLNSTLSRVNSDYFLELVEIAVSLGVPRLGFSRLVPSGQGQGMLDEMLDTGQLKALYKKILSTKIGGLEIVTGDPMAAQMLADNAEDLGDIPMGGCAAGIAGLTILPDGTITPCRRLNIPIGRAGRDSLRAIWATSDILARLRDKSQYQGKCAVCKRWAACRGCRAIAYAYSQARGGFDFLAEDPQCFIQPD